MKLRRLNVSYRRARRLSLEFFVKLRNACEAEIERLKPEEAKEHKWDPSKIMWTEAQGSKGTYQRSEDTSNLDFQEMVADLNAHKGKMNRDGFFIWLFDNKTTVGRKPSKK